MNKPVLFHTDRFPDLTINTPTGPVTFVDGDLTLTDEGQMDSVRSVAFENGITESPKPAAKHKAKPKAKSRKPAKAKAAAPTTFQPVTPKPVVPAPTPTPEPVKPTPTFSTFQKQT